MMSADLKTKLNTYKDLTENYLGACLKNRDIPPRLLEAMEYSLLAGGKRLRPALCLAVCDLLGGRREAVLPFAAALEIIHTYTLVHDDLPAMDNDDLRRGKPTNHVVFGEATAILAGDGLLTEAFGFMTRPAALGVRPERVLEAIAAASGATGAAGTVGGQVLDMDFTGKNGVSLEELANMHARKTGQLFRISCLAGAILSEADAAACHQRKRQAIQTALPVLFTELRHQQKIEADTDNQNGQYLLKNVGLNVLNQQRAAGRAEKGHQNIELLVGKIHHLAANEIQ